MVTMTTATMKTELKWQQYYNDNSYHDNRIIITTVTMTTELP